MLAKVCAQHHLIFELGTICDAVVKLSRISKHQRNHCIGIFAKTQRYDFCEVCHLERPSKTLLHRFYCPRFYTMTNCQLCGLM